MGGSTSREGQDVDPPIKVPLVNGLDEGTFLGGSTYQVGGARACDDGTFMGGSTYLSELDVDVDMGYVGTPPMTLVWYLSPLQRHP